MSGLSEFLLIFTVLLHSSLPLPSGPSPRSSWNHAAAGAGNELTTPAGFIDCALCKTTIREIKDLLELNKTFEELYPSGVKVCESLLDKLSLNGHYMCPGMVFAYGVPIQVVITQGMLDPPTICQDLNACSHTHSSKTKPTTLDNFLLLFQQLLKRLLTGSDGTSPANYPLLGKGIWSDSSLDYNQSLHVSDERAASSRKRPVHPKSGKITFLQLTDLHFDLEYAEGSPTDCGLYFCCRSWYNGTGKAGHFGSFKCDLPLVTLELLFKAISNLIPSPDFIIYTGDSPPHDVWNETLTSQIRASQVVVEYLANTFPTTTIFPVMGNHDSWPANVYSGVYPEYQMLTRNLSQIWQKWVELSPEATATVARGGYYSTEVMKGLRLISFNSNYGYLLNFYSFLNFENEQYREQWVWLVKELHRARKHGEKVLLLGHHPPGDRDNWPEYGHRYLKLVKEFQDIIVGHLFGHTHMDHMQLIQDEEGVYGTVMVAPSATPFGHINPSFRAFTMDTHSMTLLNYTQYHLDLARANELYQEGREDEVKFVAAYSSDEEYQLPDLSPSSWRKFVDRLSTHSELLDAYYYNRYGRSKKEDQTCDKKCQRQMLCGANHVISADLLACLDD